MGNGWVQVVRDAPLNGERDYHNIIGDGSGTSIVDACVNWIARNFPEAPPAHWTTKPDGNRDMVRNSAIVDLLNEPTYDPTIGRGWYSGVHLMMATLVSWNIDGNAYWLKIRNKYGAVIQLWYIPHWLIQPRWPFDGSKYISFYDYRPYGTIIEVPAEDVIHFRFGIDPENPRMGWSQLKGELRQIATDEERARFSFSILKNLGFPGVVIAPADKDAPEIEDPEATKMAYMQKFTGDRRGEPLVMRGATSITTFGFDPKSMDLSAFADIAEERITSALSLPAAVVGFGAGLQEAHTNATYRELREQAWEAKLIPDGRLIGADLKAQLAPEFISDRAVLKKTVIGFDLKQVRALQDDENKKAERWKTLTSGRIARVDEARSAFDLPTTPADEIYLEPISVTPVGKDGKAIEPPAPPSPPPGGPPAPGDQLPPAKPPLALAPPAGAAPPKEFLAALASLKLLVERQAADGRRDDDVSSAIRAMEKATTSRDAALLAGLTELAKAIASRPVDVTIIEATKTGELREVLERDERGGAKTVRVTPLPAVRQNGNGGGT